MRCWNLDSKLCGSFDCSTSGVQWSWNHCNFPRSLFFLSSTFSHSLVSLPQTICMPIVLSSLFDFGLPSSACMTCTINFHPCCKFTCYNVHRHTHWHIHILSSGFRFVHSKLVEMIKLIEAVFTLIKQLKRRLKQTKKREKKRVLPKVFQWDWWGQTLIRHTTFVNGFRATKRVAKRMNHFNY